MIMESQLFLNASEKQSGELLEPPTCELFFVLYIFLLSKIKIVYYYFARLFINR